MSEVVSDLFSLENFARSGAAAAFAYAAAPVVFQGPAVFSFSAVPGLSGVQVDKSTGLAVIAFLTATAIDLIQSRILNRTKEGRLASYPSLAVHVAGGGLLFAVLPKLMGRGQLGLVSNSDAAKQLFLIGALSEVFSQYFYEGYLNPAGQGQYRF